MNKKIITIEPAKIISNKSHELASFRKRKVAGYARVSTDHEDQSTSYEAQMNYYTEYINSRSDWEFVKMYSDEGISGTNTKRRVGFKEMIEDALNGKIDLIITKSVSRFARNTVDSLTTVRKLKDVGVEIYFEKENIWTLDSKGELLITIMSSLAQEESRSISENITWTKRKMAAQGKVAFGYANVLGFKAKKEGGFEIDKEEAKVVRYIFGLFLKGENPNSIASILTEKGIPTPGGKKKWSYSTVNNILKNEKYKGDALLQKSFTVDFLSKTRKNNEGELPQYYVENSHEAIIDKATFDLVQFELNNSNNRMKTSYFGKVICGCCGGSYGRHVWHSTSKYKIYLYRCNKKYKNKKKCETPNVSGEEIEKWIVEGIDRIIKNKKEIIENLEILLLTLEDNESLISEIESLENKLNSIQESIEKLVNKNSRVAQNQILYQKDYDALVDEYYRLEPSLIEKEIKLKRRRKQVVDIKSFMKILEKQERLVTKFDTKLFNTLVDKLVIYKENKIEVHFKNGQVISL